MTAYKVRKVNHANRGFSSLMQINTHKSHEKNLLLNPYGRQPESKLSLSRGERTESRWNARASGKARSASPFACHSRVTSHDIPQTECLLAGYVVVKNFPKLYFWQTGYLRITFSLSFKMTFGIHSFSLKLVFIHKQLKPGACYNVFDINSCAPGLALTKR